MSETDNTFDIVIDIVSDEYRKCVEKARELFTDEQAIQSASATMFINATKEKSSVSSYLNTLKDRIAKLNQEAIPSAVQVWEWHFRDFIQEYGGRIKSQITYYVSQNAPPEVIERNVKERYYHLRCETLDHDQQEALAEQLFGDKKL